MAPAAVLDVRRLLRFTGYRSAQVGLIGIGLILLVALVGPSVAPHGPSEIVALPFDDPSSKALLGTDFLGRDVLSRVLSGGRMLLALGVAATAIAYVLGVGIGLAAGYSRSLIDPVLMRSIDVLLGVPAILVLLIVLTGAGRNPAALVVAVAITQVPWIARLVRVAALETSTRGYVEAAVARGEGTPAVLRREIFPNILNIILTDAGIRFTRSILLIASVNFLGVALQPPAADWALMISENRVGLDIQPWAAAVPAALIAILTISVNLVVDGIAYSLGISDVRPVGR